MFHDLDATLAQLLLRELVATYPDIKADNISFAAPDDEFRRGGYKSPTLNLFLYDVRENWELRSSEWTYERRNGKVTRQGPPIRVDCAYLITAWSAESGPQAVAAEHRLLGNVARALLKHRQLPDDVLQGGLQGAEPPPQASAIQQGQLQSLGEFWQAMGGRPRAALSYTVTVSMPISEPDDLGPPVTEKVIRIRQGLEEA